MVKFEGIVNLRGKKVVLENIENPILQRILHTRLRKDKFNFNYGDSSGYSEHSENKSERYEDRYRDEHADRHKDNYSDRHKDNHTDKSGGYDDVNVSSEYWDSHHGDHTDRGHSESIENGYSEHKDYYPDFYKT